MNEQFLYLLEKYVPRSRVREMAGKQFFDALVNYEPNLDIYSVEALAVRIRSNSKNLKAVYSLLPEKINTSKADFISKYLIVDSELKDVKLDHVNLERRLHDFQYRSYRLCLTQLFDGKKKILLHLPTGTGKTRTASEVLLTYISNRRLFDSSDTSVAIWIAQSSELCEQAFNTIVQTVNARSVIDLDVIGLWGDKEFSSPQRATIFVVTIQKLMNIIQQEDFASISALVDLTIFDEAHFVGSKWFSVLEWFEKAQVPILGLTATPGGDKVDHLSAFYEYNRISLNDPDYEEYQDPIGFLRDMEYLAYLDLIDLETGSSLTISEEDGEYRTKKSSLNRLVIDEARNSMLINAIISEVNESRKTLVFACSVQHCYFLKVMLEINGIESEVIEGNTVGRSSILSKFKDDSSTLNCIINFNVLTAGFDAPSLNTLIIARPVSSSVQYSQMVGRVLRGPKNSGNTKNRLITLSDNVLHGSYNDMLNKFNQYYL